MEESLADPFGVASHPPLRVVLEVCGRQVFYEKEKAWPKDTVLTELPNNKLQIEITIRDYYSFMRYIHSFIPFIKIVSPEPMAKWALWDLREALKLYGYSHEELAKIQPEEVPWPEGEAEILNRI